MNILIIGGTGYIGSKVVRKLIEAGHVLVCTCRSESNFSRLEGIKEQIQWIPASIDGIKSAAQSLNIDYVLNMACNYGKKNGNSYEDILRTNIGFPLEILDTMYTHGTNHFLTIGTGLPDKLNMYSFSKKILSDFGRFFADKHDIIFNNIKPEMFYGADEPKNRFFPTIIEKMIKGEVVETTLGTQHRDIISAKDVVDAILMVVNADLTGYHDIPVGTGIAPTISEVIDYIWEQTGRKSEVRKGAIPMRQNEPDCVADISTMASIGTWQPVDWRTGIYQMINVLKRENEKNEITH